MSRALVLFFALAGLSAVAIWLADNPGALVVHWRGYEIRTSFVAGLGAALAVSAVVLIGYRLAAIVWRGPAGFGVFMTDRRRRKGYLALSRGMVAVAAGDARAARLCAARAERLLDEPALTLLLAAQAAQLDGDAAAATGHFQAMLAAPETEFLGLRGLFVQAQRAGDEAAALNYARRAFAARPKTPWAGQAVLTLEARRGAWREAEATLERTLAAGLIDRDAARRKRAVVLTAMALAAEEEARDMAGEARAHRRHDARDLALEAAGLAPDLAPAVALAGRLAGAFGRLRKAAKVLEKGWAAAPHPDIAQAYAGLNRDESARDRLSRTRFLTKANPDHTESRFALGRAAIDARDWVAARAALAPLAAGAPSVRVCQLMAEIEEGEQGDRGSAREWLARALHAPRDAQWVCAGYSSPDWSPVCPATGELDGLAWRVPEAQIAAAAPLPRAPAPFVPGGEPARGEKTYKTEPGPDLPRPIVAPDDPGPPAPDEDDEELTEAKW